jgi:hypothetical protein
MSGLGVAYCVARGSGADTLLLTAKFREWCSSGAYPQSATTRI